MFNGDTITGYVTNDGDGIHIWLNRSFIQEIQLGISTVETNWHCYMNAVPTRETPCVELEYKSDFICFLPKPLNIDPDDSSTNSSTDNETFNDGKPSYNELLLKISDLQNKYDRLHNKYSRLKNSTKEMSIKSNNLSEMSKLKNNDWKGQIIYQKFNFCTKFM